MNPVHAEVNLALARAIEAMAAAARRHIAEHGITAADPKYLEKTALWGMARPNYATVSINTRDRATQNALRKQGFAFWPNRSMGMLNEDLILDTLAGVVGRRIVPADVSIYVAMGEAWSGAFFPPGAARVFHCPLNYADLYAQQMVEQESAKRTHALLEEREAAAVEGLGLDEQQARHFLGLSQDWSAYTHAQVRRWAKGWLRNRPRASVPLPPWAEEAIAWDVLDTFDKAQFGCMPSRRHLVLKSDGKHYVLLPKKRWSPPKDREALAALVKSVGGA